MSNNFFRFKRFKINHDRCAMKVGTDGVLLGAWGCVDGKRILDIGTGSGLIALMAAQRNPDAEVLGIDIDEGAVSQAQENFVESPFGERVGCILQDILTFRPKECYDAILCNPPFYTEDTLPPDMARSLARNSASLPFEYLIGSVCKILSEKGVFSVILPVQAMQTFTGLCLDKGLYLVRRCLVRTTPKKTPRRALLTFAMDNSQATEETELCLMNPDGSRSLAYSELTKDFYL